MILRRILAPTWPKTVWIELAKMRTAIFLLIAAGVVNLAGTFVTQGLPSSDHLTVFGPFWGNLWLLIGLDDVLKTWWFNGILLLLLASVSACLYNQTGRMLKAYRLPKSPPKSLIGWIKIEKKIAQTLIPKPSKEFPEATYSQKSRHVRIGYLCLHFGILFIAIAALISGTFGWRGTLNLRIQEPDHIALIFRGDHPRPVFLPFSVTAETFEITRYADDTPRQYQSELVLNNRENGEEVARGITAVNRPFRHNGYAFYQADFGDAGSPLTLNFLPLNQTLTLPENLQTTVYETIEAEDITVEIFDGRNQTPGTPPNTLFGKSDERMGPSIDLALMSPITEGHVLRLYKNHPNLLGLPDGEDTEGNRRFVPLALGVTWNTENIHILGKLLQLDPTVENLQTHATPLLETLPPGQRLLTATKLLSSLPVLQELNLPTLPVLSTFEPTVYTGLQVAFDPGANLFWLACLLTLLGIFLLLGQTHIEIWHNKKTNQYHLRTHRGLRHTKKLLTPSNTKGA